MTPLQEEAIDLFARTGLVAHREGVLPEAMAELAIRLDLAGHSDLLGQLVDTDWRPASHKQAPDPTPKTPPPPPPPPPGGR